MRNKQDINTNQCDKCGKIQNSGELSCWDGEDDYQGLALCNKCIIELEQKDKLKETK